MEKDANKDGEKKRGDKAVKRNKMYYFFQLAQLI